MRHIATFLIALFGVGSVWTPALGSGAELKSEATALRLSVLGTLVPVAGLAVRVAF